MNTHSLQIQEPSPNWWVDGEGVGFREGQRAALDGTINAVDLDPRLVHAFLTGRFIQTFGHKLDVEKIGESKFRFRVSAAV